MPTRAPLPYFLQPYTGTKSRTTCPSCSIPRSFTRYIDAETGAHLPAEYGRCNRESKCGYDCSPYARPAAGGPSLAAQWSRSGHSIGPAVTFRPLSVPAAPALTIPTDLFRASLSHYQDNALARLLEERFGSEVTNDLLARFRLGTSTFWSGACVFWLIDPQGRVRGGQVVLYDETGHTVKLPKRHTTWVHTALKKACQQRGEQLPAWWSQYDQTGLKSPCLFGLPQLNTEPRRKPVAIVESAKTAILATPHFPNFIWMATMGLSYLTPERLEPLRGRRVVLFPDAGAFAQWNRKAEALRRSGFDITVSHELEQRATPAERQAGLDLADVILREAPAQYTPKVEVVK